MKQTAIQVMQDIQDARLKHYEAKIKQLEEKYAEEAAKILQEEIDWELITDMMVAVGWTTVELPKFFASGPTLDMTRWLNNECKHHWMHRANSWVFENNEEAALFKLTWS
jgi:hypothetical protein